MRFSFFLLLSMVLLALARQAAAASFISGCSVSGMDYSGLHQSEDLTVSDGVQYDYYFNLCGPVQNSACQAVSTSISACQVNIDTGNAYNLGTWPGASLAYLNNDATQGILYQTANGANCGGSPRQVEIEAVCSNYDGSPDIVNADGCTYAFSVNLKAACKSTTPVPASSSKSGLSGGWIFIIILVVVIPVYLLAGCLYNTKKNGAATWSERCPNYAFWSSIPGLCKDGASFAWGKVRGVSGSRGGSSASTYETL